MRTRILGLATTAALFILGTSGASAEVRIGVALPRTGLSPRLASRSRTG